MIGLLRSLRRRNKSAGDCSREICSWGRMLDEYVGMFGLSEPDLKSRILDCGGGPASFNAELTAHGGQIVSCDPVYELSLPDMEKRINDSRANVTDYVAKNPGEYVWKTFRSVDELIEKRMNAARLFFEDYERGSREKRYVPASLPSLPFPDHSFDLAGLPIEEIVRAARRTKAEFIVLSSTIEPASAELRNWIGALAHANLEDKTVLVGSGFQRSRIYSESKVRAAAGNYADVVRSLRQIISAK